MSVGCVASKPSLCQGAPWGERGPGCSSAVPERALPFGEGVLGWDAELVMFIAFPSRSLQKKVGRFLCLPEAHQLLLLQSRLWVPGHFREAHSMPVPGSVPWALGVGAACAPSAALGSALPGQVALPLCPPAGHRVDRSDRMSAPT